MALEQVVAPRAHLPAGQGPCGLASVLGFREVTVQVIGQWPLLQLCALYPLLQHHQDEGQRPTPGLPLAVLPSGLARALSGQSPRCGLSAVRGT